MGLLKTKQQEFALDLGVLLTWGLERLRETYPSARLRMAEGYVGDTAGKNRYSPHRRDGGHFKRLAQDLVLDIDDSVVESSEHPAWAILGEFWRNLRPGNGTGGKADANHFGREDGGIF